MNQLRQFYFLLKWFCAIVIVSLLCGSSAALFLFCLDAITQQRIAYPAFYIALPFGGLAIVWLYERFGKNKIGGTQQIIANIYLPEHQLPIAIAPLIFISTLLTHLGGGSAGREGTAVQIGGTLATTCKKIFFKNDKNAHQILIIMGISGGFAAVFGTPLAALFFALEVAFIKKTNLTFLLPSACTAFLSHYICLAFGITHTNYTLTIFPILQFSTLFFIAVIGIMAGLSARLFIQAMSVSTFFLTKKIPQATARIFIGGSLISILLYAFTAYNYAGLGIATISHCFIDAAPWHTFLCKLFFTVLTLSVGFKGGEATPLFFIGAALGSTLSVIFGLPIGFAAGIGFASVFAAATHTPFACALMSIELFGFKMFPFALLACYIAYFVVGKKNVYNTHSLSIDHSLLNRYK